ncbi:hypothetical protein, partial [Pseudoalteromonas sp.]|uniref:hypothetical protein n=1 Tax=Pseudoalteromonas sp. TaxID=53249 RepID=UPI002357865C
ELNCPWRKGKQLFWCENFPGGKAFRLAPSKNGKRLSTVLTMELHFYEETKPKGTDIKIQVKMLPRRDSCVTPVTLAS